MGLKLHWFRAHVRIAKPKLHGPRATNVAVTSDPSTVAVTGFYHQRDFENTEERMDLSTIHRSLGEMASEAQHGGTASADTHSGPRSPTHPNPKRTPGRPEGAVPDATKPKMVNGEVMGRRDPPREEGKRTPNSTDDSAAPNPRSRSQEETSNETTNPLFAMVGKRRATPRNDQDDGEAEREETKSRKDAKRNTTPERLNGGDQEATSSNQEKKTKKKKEPKANVKKEKKQTKEFFKKKGNKAHTTEKNLGGGMPKPEPEKLPKVDPNAPTMRNPLLSYNTDSTAPRPAERSSNRNAVLLYDEGTDEEEFLRTGNIRVMAPKGPSLQGLAKVDKKAIDSYEDEEFDA